MGEGKLCWPGRFLIQIYDRGLRPYVSPRASCTPVMLCVVPSPVMAAQPERLSAIVMGLLCFSSLCFAFLSSLHFLSGLNLESCPHLRDSI